MLRYLEPADAGRPKRIREVLDEKVAAMAEKGTTRRKGPWSTWSQLKKRQMVQAWAAMSYSYKHLRLHYGPKCPPACTIKGWHQAVDNDQPLYPAGRPSVLPVDVERQVVDYVDSLRRNGATADNECLAVVAHELVNVNGVGGGETMALGVPWARSFRRRYKLKVRSPCTDRLDRVEDVANDNEWRSKLDRIINAPATFGLPYPN